jgi:hypothetical protein
LHLHKQCANHTTEADKNDSEEDKNTLKQAFAASAATEDKDKIAKEGRHPDGSKAVQLSK